MNTRDWIEQTQHYLADRIPVEKLSFKKMTADKTVPVHKMSWAYYLGGLTLFFFIVQLVTGLLLLFYYQPSVSDAHASVEYITNHVRGGALVRNLHTWSCSLMILGALVHLLTTFAMKAFSKPRELTWITGVLLLLLLFGFGFTGYLLPWHQIAVNATKVGLQSIEQTGPYLPGAIDHLPTQAKELIQGDASVGQATLSRFFGVHVVILPLAFIGLLGFHLLSVQLHGMSKGVDKPIEKTERFFPVFVIKDFTIWGLAFFVAFILALCLPFESFFSYPLFAPYDAMGATPDGIKPEWYFFFMYYPLEMLPFWVIMLASGVLVGVLFLTPWIFRNTSRRVLTFIAILAGIYLFVMTVFGQSIYELVKGGH